LRGWELPCCSRAGVSDRSQPGIDPRLQPRLRAELASQRLCVPSHRKQVAKLEKTLKEKLPGLEITVFGRFRDLEDALQTKPPDALITSNALIVSQGFPVALQGVAGGADWEPYVLLSQGRALEGSLAGRSSASSISWDASAPRSSSRKLLGTDEIKLKRVTKLEDLLPLLQFSAAEAVLVPSASVKDVSERSRLLLSVLALPDARVKLRRWGC